MDFTELLQSLHTLNEDELFYENYQKKKKDPRAFHQYLQSLDRKVLLDRHLIVPEFPETMPPPVLTEKLYKDDVGLRVSKHNCYTPVFRHSHDFFEAFYVIEGSCEHIIEDRHQILYMGDFCIIPPGVEHTISVQDTSIIISMSMLKKTIVNTFNNPLFHKKNILADFFLKNIYIKDANNYLIFHTGNDENMKQLIYQMLMESTNHYPEYQEILNFLHGLFFANLVRYYLSSAEFPHFSGKSTAAAYGIVTYIQENHSTITLKQVAEKFHYTPEYTSRFIKAMTGKSFTELVLNYRMDHAVSLLKDTRLTIADIAYEVGYENAETFNRVFKKSFSCTPTAYRRNH